MVFSAKISNATFPDGSPDTTDSFIVPGAITPAPVVVDAVGLGIPVDPAALVEYHLSSPSTFSASVLSAWDSVKNIEVNNDSAADVTLHNFTRVDVDLGSGASHVKVTDVKRGSIKTDDSDDIIEVTSFTNDDSIGNLMEISSGGGNDVVTYVGDKGHSILDADLDSGSDSLNIGGAYKSSTVSAGSGNDFIKAGVGADYIHGDSGSDSVLGGANNDTIYGDTGKDTIHGESGNDYLSGDGGADSMSGGKGEDTLLGGGSSDILNGGVHNDYLEGNGGSDTLKGGDGEDVIIAGSGADIIIGGAGADDLTGDGGKDTFTYNLVTDSTALLTDTINDFKEGYDVIDVSGLATSFANLAVSFAAGVTTITDTTSVFEVDLAGDHTTISDTDFIFV